MPTLRLLYQVSGMPGTQEAPSKYQPPLQVIAVLILDF